MQVNRLMERAGRHNLTPQLIGRLIFAGLPAALLVLTRFGTQVGAATRVCMVYGLTNGLLTILHGTLPQVIFSSRHYGAISGAMARPVLLAKTAGPVVAGMMVSSAEPRAIVLRGMLGLAILACVPFARAVRRAAPRCHVASVQG